MLVSQSEIEHELRDINILDIGSFYFFENFVISEFNEGVTVNWESVQQIIELVENYYGEGTKVAYISNRVYSYSITPQDWLKYFRFKNIISVFAIVSYNTITKSNVILETLFFKNKIQKFTNLTAAIDWAVKEQEKHLEKQLNQL